MNEYQHSQSTFTLDTLLPARIIPGVKATLARLYLGILYPLAYNVGYNRLYECMIRRGYNLACYTESCDETVEVGFSRPQHIFNIANNQSEHVSRTWNAFFQLLIILDKRLH